WGGTAVYGSFRAIVGDEKTLVLQSEDYAIPPGPDAGTLDRLAALLVDDAEHAVERLTDCLLQRPAGQGFSNRVEKCDPPLGVGGNHGIANASEGDTTPLWVEMHGLFGLRHDDLPFALRLASHGNHYSLTGPSAANNLCKLSKPTA